MKTNKVLFLIILALTLFVGCEKRKKVDSYYSTLVGADIEISDDMERNEYKSELAQVHENGTFSEFLENTVDYTWKQENYRHRR